MCVCVWGGCGDVCVCVFFLFCCCLFVSLFVFCLFVFVCFLFFVCLFLCFCFLATCRIVCHFKFLKKSISPKWHYDYTIAHTRQYIMVFSIYVSWSLVCIMVFSIYVHRVLLEVGISTCKRSNMSIDRAKCKC